MIRPRGAIEAVAAIDYRCEPYHWAFGHDETARIEAHWLALKAAKPAMFDGRVLVAHRLALDPEGGGTLRGAAFETGYKPFICWRDTGFPGAPVVNLFAMAALQTADGAFMLGRMSAGTTSAGRLYFPAGTPEPADVVDGVVDLEGNALRELEEETGITAAEVTRDPGWILVYDEARVACMKQLRSPLTAAEIIARFTVFRDAQDDPELDALVPIRGIADLDEALMPGFMIAFLRRAFAIA